MYYISLIVFLIWWESCVFCSGLKLERGPGEEEEDRRSWWLYLRGHSWVLSTLGSADHLLIGQAPIEVLGDPVLGTGGPPARSNHGGGGYKCWLVLGPASLGRYLGGGGQPPTSWLGPSAAPASWAGWCWLLSPCRVQSSSRSWLLGSAFLRPWFLSEAIAAALLFAGLCLDYMSLYNFLFSWS